MRLLRLLLRLYPSSFRAEYGPEMAAVFRARRRAASGLGIASVWLDAAVDVLRNAAGAHLDILRQDLRDAARTLSRARGFAAAVVLITALGVGANTAVLSLADHVLFRPLPLADADRLVNVWEVERNQGYGRFEPSPANYRDWKRMTRSFEQMAAYHTVSTNLLGRGEPTRLDGVAVSADLLPMIGARPALGRLFTPAEDAAGAPGTALLGDGLWRSLFGGDPGVVGRRIVLDDTPYTVIGVMPRGFCYPDRTTALWTATRFDADDFEDRTNTYLHVVAKLRRGVSVEQAAAEMDVVSARLEREYPKDNAHIGAAVRRLRDEVPAQSRALLLALLSAGACVLLIACTNLANLMMARSSARRAELAVRTALGAGSDRLVRQLLTEAAVLGGLGGLLGAAIAAVVVPLLARLVPTTLPIAAAPSVDGRLLALAAATTGLTVIGFGVVPGLRACRGAVATDLRERGTSGGGRRVRSALVVAEVMASVALVVSAGLLLQSLWRVQAVDPGFKAGGVLTLRTTLPVPRYASTVRRIQFYQRVLSEVRALPGVAGAAYTSGLPMVMRGGIWTVQVEGRQPVAGVPESVGLRYVSPGYFETMGIPQRLGRDVSDRDAGTAPMVAVVSASFAKKYWPGQDPLGRRFGVAFFTRTVVGVVADVRVRGLERESEPQVYIPYAQIPDGYMPYYMPKDLVVRTALDTAAVVPAVRAILGRADPEQPISDIQPLDEVLRAETAPRRLQLSVLGAFAALAALLAATGIHAVLSFIFAGRRREIGIRMALGATRRQVVGLVLAEGLTLAACGVAAGLALAYAAGQSMRALLAGGGPADGRVFAGGAAIALLVALGASLGPAVHVSRIDPTSVMRGE